MRRLLKISNWAFQCHYYYYYWTGKYAEYLQTGRAEVLRGSRKFPSKAWPDHHSTDSLKQRGVEKGNGSCTSYRREQSLSNQTIIATYGQYTRVNRNGEELGGLFRTPWYHPELEIKLKLVIMIHKDSNSKNNTNDNINNSDTKRCNSRFFYNLLTVPPTLSNPYTQVARVQLCEYHVQHIRRLSCATCSLPHGTKGQLSYWIWQGWNRMYFSFISLAETISCWRQGGNRCTHRKLLPMSIRKCHILKSKTQAPIETWTCTLALVAGTC